MEPTPKKLKLALSPNPNRFAGKRGMIIFRFKREMVEIETFSKKIPNKTKKKKALVTGAGKGIGREIVLYLASQGATVIALSRTQKDLDELRKSVPKLEMIIADVADGLYFHLYFDCFLLEKKRNYFPLF